MSVALDARLRRHGTRFRLFPQPRFLEPFGEPETVWVSSLAGTLGPGPSDDRMYVVQPRADKKPYAYPDLPPYRGACAPPLTPGPDGHFDQVEPGAPEFRAAHMFGTIRRVLDIWEGYLGRQIPWHFREHLERLELVPFLDWDNAHSGYGFIEAGIDRSDDGRISYFALNFDVLAHELGHSLLFSLMGFPRDGTSSAEFLAFHESSSDLTALVAVMHFDSVVDHVLDTSRGNLYVLNELNRIGELSRTDQIRIASNSRKMSEFAAGWSNVHDLAQPLTGAVFDAFVNVYQEALVRRGLITNELWEMADAYLDAPGLQDYIQLEFDRAYERNPWQFKAALLEARDYLGTALGRIWHRLSPDELRFEVVGHEFIAIDREVNGGRYEHYIRESFDWREIGEVAPGPELENGKSDGSAPAGDVFAFPPYPRLLSFRERMALARRGHMTA